jgi:hypothetical protein
MRPGLRYCTAKDGPQGVPTGRRHGHFGLQDGNSVIMRQRGKRMPQSRGLGVDTLVLDRRRPHAVPPGAPAHAPAPRSDRTTVSHCAAGRLRRARSAQERFSPGRTAVRARRQHHCHTKVSTTPSSNGSLGWFLVLLARARGPLSLSCFGKPAGIRSQLFRDT